MKVKKVVFWILAFFYLPFVFMFYVGSDIYRLRKKTTCILKTRMIFQDVYGKVFPK
ncbi:putative membrane protein [Siphonobacter sp. SORGH_AS 1065]|nr:putative membrane protein [Siphonobacter sp. SORGH_AS_1065]